MSYILRNERLELHIDDPKESYQGSRFDWTGKITKMNYNGVPLLGLEQTDSKLINSLGRGLYNEFGIDSALGFDETEADDWFHKIGVGLLKKTTADYSFAEPYAIKPCMFFVDTDKETIKIDCIQDLHNGYGYRLQKIIQLSNERIKIVYSLLNNGEKTIETDEYCHNFLCFHEQPMGNEYSLSFPFQIQQSKFIEAINPNDAIAFGARSISFQEQPSEFFFSNLSGSKKVDARWTLRHSALNLVLDETASFATAKINLWGNKHVICPELFYHVHVRPGQTVYWSRTFSVSKMEKARNSYILRFCNLAI